MLDFYVNALRQNKNKWYSGIDIESHVNTTLHLVDDFIQHLDKNDKLLEIGCGNGIALHYLRMHGYDCRGIDRDNAFVECHNILDVSDIIEKKQIEPDNWIDYINGSDENVVFSLRFFVFDAMQFDDNIKYIKGINKTLFLQVSPDFKKSKPIIHNYLQENAIVKNENNNSFLLK